MLLSPFFFSEGGECQRRRPAVGQLFFFFFRGGPGWAGEKGHPPAFDWLLEGEH